MTPSQIKRLSGYMVFFLASSLFMYFLITAGIYPYLKNVENQFTAEGLFKGVYLNVVYSILCLLVSAVAQFVLIGKPFGNELRLYSIFRIAYFGLLSGCTIALMIYAFIQNAPIFIIMTIAPVAVAIAETVLAVFHLLEANKQLVAEEEALKNEKKK